MTAASGEYDAQSTTAAAMNAFTNSRGSAGRTDSRGTGAAARARDAGAMPITSATLTTIADDVDGHDEQRVARVVPVDPEVVPELLEHHAADQREHGDDQHVAGREGQSHPVVP